MVYNVGCSFQPWVQIVRTTAHTHSSSIRRLFRRHVDSARSPPPTMRIVSLFLSASPFSTFIFQHKHRAAHSFIRMHHAVTPTNAHISGFRVPRQLQLTNCSIHPKRSACTSTRARLCAYAWRETNFAMMSQGHQKRLRVSLSVDRYKLGVYHTP